MTKDQKIYIAFLVLAIVLLGVLLLQFLYRNVYRKKHYKEATYFVVKRIAEYEDYLLLNNYKVTFDDKHFGVIDHIIGGNKYIYLINDFPLSGIISGQLKDYQLRVVTSKNKVKEVVNPLNYNFNLIKRFNLYHNIDPTFVKGIVVINDDSSIDIKGSGENFFMVRRKDLAKLIDKLEDEDVKDIKEKALVQLLETLSKEK